MSTKKKTPKKRARKTGRRWFGRRSSPDEAVSVWQTTRLVQITGTEEGEGARPEQAEGEHPAASLLRLAGEEKYEVGRILASGGMGNVHQARDVNCRRSVAMKVLRQDQQALTDDLLRFVEEARITAQLEHPNIVPVHELGIDSGGGIYYTMKYVRGVTLTDILHDIRKGRQETIEEYPLGRLLTIFQKACDAVAFAHSKNVIHRDLKPDNIMIGGYGEVLVMDWGLAKVLTARPAAGAEPPAPPETEPPELDQQLDEMIESIRLDKDTPGLGTIRGRVLGTPGFMAPEQARARSTELDERTDLYSLGAILYSILTLRPSVKGRDVKEILRKIVNGEVIPPAVYNQWELKEGPDSAEKKVQDFRLGYLPHCPNGRIPEVLSDITMKAMAVHPDDRYPTVKSLQQDIEAYQDGLIWNLVADEDFSDPHHFEADWQVCGGYGSIEGGEMRLYGGEPQTLLFRKPLMGDVRIEFECHQESIYLNDIACFISAIRSGNWREIPSSGYEFKYGGFSNSVNVLARSDKRLWSASASPLVRGKKFRVMAERVGPRLRMVVNDQEIFRVTDTDPLSGSDRTAVGVHGWMADTRYSSIRVYSLGTPWKADILDIAERHLQRGHYVTAKDLFREVMDAFPDPIRLDRAQRGHETALHRDQTLKHIPVWQEKLESIWRGAPLSVRMDNDGLTVDISNCGILDLKPLRGLPLTTLYCNGNDIRNLEPLRGMKLATLNCGANPIKNLEPLRGMPLIKLLCEGCPVESLEPLQDMPLTMLNCGGSRLAKGLEPLAGMRLAWLSCWRSGIKTLEPLRDMTTLTELYCDGNEIETLEPLAGLPLGTLICPGNRIESLEPLRGMPLSSLHCGANRIESLEPLRGMPLNMFSCHGNRIQSLLPLEGLALGYLACGSNELTSLDPFVKTPPFSFLYECDTLPEKEIIRAHAFWWKDPRFEHHARYAEAILALRTLDVAKLKALSAEFHGHHYLFIPKFLTWKDADELCRRLGGHMLTVTSREENNFVASLLPGGSWFWLGLVTAEEGHRWVTGEEVTFVTFNDAVRERMRGEKVFCSGTWSSDLYSDARNCFMIEWDD
ncbi:MAG: protein kinase [Verrucomicrobiota bacterium]